MAGRVGDRPGGILGLLELLDQHQEAIELELLLSGRRLREVGSEGFTWRDLYVLIRGWQRTPHNAVGESIHGHAIWTVEEQLLAIAADTLAHANWQRLQKRHAPKPKPIPRPWEKTKTRQLGSDPIPISEFDDWWDSAGR